MQVGDLVVVKKGIPPEGQVGVILNTVEVAAGWRTIAYCDVLFPEGVERLRRDWWLERLEVADATR
jgi:hypothetical protein